ncbi:MAG: efflux RND transporter periplasmic adaptor subunit [Planctomycetota bacterium]
MKLNPTLCLLAALATLGPNVSAQQPQTQRRTAATSSLPGIALPERNVRISTPVEGVITTIHVAEGTRVTKGEALAQLDDRVARAAVEAARLAADQRAQIAHAKAEVDLARQKFDRLEAAGDAINALQLAEARIRLAQADASLASARQAQRQGELNLALEEARLDRMTIRAPFSGRISKITTEEGATMTTQHELLHLVSLETLVTDVYAPLSMFDQLEVGATYRLQAGAPINRLVDAKLLYIDPVLEAASQRCRLRFRIQNPESTMPAGFTVRLTNNLQPVTTNPAPSRGR